MFTTTIKVNQSADWIRKQINELNGSPDADLKTLFPNPPYFIVKKKKSILTSPCAALLSIRFPDQPRQIVRVYFLPNIFFILSFLCFILSFFFSLQSYKHALLAQEYAIKAHELSANYPLLPAPSFVWGRHLPALFFTIFFGTIMYQEKRVIKQYLQKIFIA